MNTTTFDHVCYKIAWYALIIGFILFIFLIFLNLTKRGWIPTGTEANLYYNGFKGVI